MIVFYSAIEVKFWQSPTTSPNEHHESAILVGIELGTEAGIGSEESLDELKALTESAGAEVAGSRSPAPESP